MSRKMMWTTVVFVVFAFATLMVFFWVRDGSLERAGVVNSNWGPRWACVPRATRSTSAVR